MVRRLIRAVILGVRPRLQGEHQELVSVCSLAPNPIVKEPGHQVPSWLERRYDVVEIVAVKDVVLQG